MNAAGKNNSPANNCDLFFTEAQLKAEIAKCEYCEPKPCKTACPADCSPADFIRAAALGAPSDIARCAALIMGKNPLGGVCGLVCPDKHCMAACVHKKFDGAVNIPKVQATLVHLAKEKKLMPKHTTAKANGKKVAVVGGGPAGLAAAAWLGQQGYSVTIFERDAELGGMCRAIPDFRLPKADLKSDIDWLLSLGQIKVELKSKIENAAQLAEKGFDAVLVTAGLWAPINLGVKGEEAALKGTEYLINPTAYKLSGNVAVIGGGATAYDCAMTAAKNGAARVEMFALESLGEMPLAANERRELNESNIDVSGRMRVTQILTNGQTVTGLQTVKVRLKSGAKFNLADIENIAGSESTRNDFNQVIVAIGNRAEIKPSEQAKIFFAGDVSEGPTTVVEAAASGKNMAEQIHNFLQGDQQATHISRRTNGAVKSQGQISGYNFTPVSLQTDFFGRSIISPFLLSAAPPSDGLEQMRLAYEAGWAGGVMKTAFDNVPIHIPAEYMFAFNKETYANCDNVSGHSLERVCREITQLVKAFPDRLTMGSTGGPVTGKDDEDRRQWLSNTRKLEEAGAMGIEYSLSCPQGGDGTEGDIVSQNVRLTTKIIDWIMEGGNGEVPKLFKLTGAVTSVAVIVAAIKEVLAKYPNKKAGVTLANTFPTLSFRPGSKKTWDEGIVVGMSGDGVLPISYLTLAKVAHLGVAVSGNGGPMNYKASADFLALGAKTVQYCTIVMKDGYHVIDELNMGLSHLMAQRGIKSMKELIGVALPQPIRDFMELSPVKKISHPRAELCLHCGNCSRCPYLAISRGPDGNPVTDASHCIGCSICSLKCFSGAIIMRDRTKEELAALKEH